MTDSVILEAQVGLHLLHQLLTLGAHEDNADAVLISPVPSPLLLLWDAEGGEELMLPKLPRPDALAERHFVVPKPRQNQGDFTPVHST